MGFRTEPGTQCLLVFALDGESRGLRDAHRQHLLGEGGGGGQESSFGKKILKPRREGCLAVRQEERSKKVGTF